MALPGELKGRLTEHMQREVNVVGFSEDLHDGKVRVYVSSEQEAERGVPAFEGYPVEYVNVGELKNLATAEPMAPTIRKEKVRPLVGGASIAPADQAYSGTLGFFVKDKSGQIGLLTNAHVLLNSASKDVLQPSKEDGGTSGDSVATRTLSIDDGAKNVDAAYALLTKQSDYKAEILELGGISGSRAAEKETVKKSGRTTGLTSGTITDTNATITVGSITYHHQIVITTSGQFSAGGDSGSVIVADKDKKVVGLLKACNPAGTYTVANNIGDVETALGVTVV